MVYTVYGIDPVGPLQAHYPFIPYFLIIFNVGLYQGAWSEQTVNGVCINFAHGRMSRLEEFHFGPRMAVHVSF